MSTPTAANPGTNAPLAVLDTNVVLDLWLFADSRAGRLCEAVASGALGVLVTAPMLAELADVLGRPFAAGWPIAPAQVQAALSRSAWLVETPPSRGTRPPRCSDPDDQKFIDLAWCWPVQWLISRDRAVLKLARAARAHGLRIVTPENWAED